MIIMPISTLLVGTKAMQDVLAKLMADGTPVEAVKDMLAFHEFTDVIGLPEILELEGRFAG